MCSYMQVECFLLVPIAAGSNVREILCLKQLVGGGSAFSLEADLELSIHLHQNHSSYSSSGA